MADRKFIDELFISNFKYFPSIEGNVKPIKIDGKHLLLYGENGSGKSSIFWSLYTLLECANKTSKAEINKYFNYSKKQNLLNINANPLPVPDNNKVNNAFVKLSLKDDTTNYYEISFDNLNINDIDEAKESNYASDFINYKFLYSAFNFRHRDRIDLFEHFEYNIFPYLKFAPCIIWRKNPNTSVWEEIETENANEVIDFLENGPIHRDLPDGRKDYDKRTYRIKEIESRIEKAITELKKWETHINTRGNEILKDELGYTDIDFKIEVKLESTFHLTERKYTPPKVHIWLTIPNYEGKVDKVHRLHSFLNEAKLTAISLAIRFAVLERRTTSAEVKLLVLDDLMISLDMNNRNKVIDFVLKNYLSNFQVFILTHDKSLFDFIQLKINEWDNKTNWSIKEMYSGIDNKPVIIEDNLELIDKADAYFKAYDYYSAGNNIRKAIEKLLEFLLPDTIRITTRDLDHELRQLFGFYDDNGWGHIIDSTLRSNLLNYKDIVFNPSSHFDLRSPLYKIEIEKAFEVYNILNAIPKLKRHLLVGMRANLFYKNDEKDYSATFILRENLYAVEIPGEPIRLSDPKHNLISYSLNKIPFLDKETGESKSSADQESAKNHISKLSERILRITHFINPTDLIELKDFTLLDGRSLKDIVN